MIWLLMRHYVGIYLMQFVTRDDFEENRREMIEQLLGEYNARRHDWKRTRDGTALKGGVSTESTTIAT